MEMRVGTVLGGLVLLLAFVQNARPQSASEAEFGRGYTLYSRKQFAAAKPVLESVLADRDAVLKDYSLYYLGRIAIALEDWGTARKRFDQLEREYPDSRLTSDAAFQLVRIDLEQNRYHQVIERASSLWKQHREGGARARAAYYLGRGYDGLGQIRAALRQYQAARKQAPRSSWAAEAKKQLAHLRSIHPELAVKGSGAVLEEAQQLYEEADYGAAEAYYRRVLEEARYRQPALRGLARVYRRTRQREAEEKVQRDIVRSYAGTALAGTALARIATIQWNRDDNEQALTTFREFKRKYPHHEDAGYATYAIGRIYESLGDWSAAIESYRSFESVYKGSRFRDDAAWRLAWIYYLRSNYRAARLSFQDIASRPGNFDTAASFWEAISLEALGMDGEARRLYRMLVRDSVNPYYRGLARERLTALGEVQVELATTEQQELEVARIPLNSRAAFHFVRAQALARISLNRFARLELDRVKSVSRPDVDLKRFLMREYAAVQAYDASVALAYELPDSPDALRHRFPLAYWDVVRHHAARVGVDPFLVVALIRQESLFNTDAVSPADALGLMQLLHRTARNEAADLGLPEPRRERLLDPEFNVQLGTHHLKRLLTRYGDSPIKALAAYNAGTKPVERWSKNLGTANDYEFAERITYKETRLYVKKVLRNYWVYKQLYGEERALDRRTEEGPRDHRTTGPPDHGTEGGPPGEEERQ